MIENSFSSTNSIVHRLDPRIKIIAAMLFSVLVATADRLPVLVLALLFSGSLVMISHLDIKRVFWRIFVVNGFILTLWIVLPFSCQGEKLFSVGLLGVSWEGIICALFITIKSNAILLGCIALLSTSPVFSLVQALHRLHIPDKLVHLFFFSYRYIHVIHEEYVGLVNAMRVRCFEGRTDMHSYKTYANLVGMIFLKSYDRSEKVYKAMLSRGFKGRFFALDHFALKSSDVTFGVVLFLCLAGLFIFRVA